MNHATVCFYRPYHAFQHVTTDEAGQANPFQPGCKHREASDTQGENNTRFAKPYFASGPTLFATLIPLSTLHLQKSCYRNNKKIAAIIVEVVVGVVEVEEVVVLVVVEEEEEVVVVVVVVAVAVVQ